MAERCRALALALLLAAAPPAHAHDSEEGVHFERIAVGAFLVTGVAVWAWYHFVHQRQAPPPPPPPPETPE